jgi:hypothetical protein
MLRLKLYIIIVFLSSCCISYAQQDSLHKYDVFIERGLERKLEYPDIATPRPGLNLLQISIKDSIIKVRSLFLSDSIFNISNNYQSIGKLLSRINLGATKTKYKIIAPIYFISMEEDAPPLSDKIKTILNKRLDKLQKRKHTIVLKPITIVGIVSIPHPNYHLIQ